MKSGKPAQMALIFLALVYIMMLGGGMYEQLNITSKIAAAPPKSLAMMQGPYGFNPIRFWVMFRPFTILAFIVAVVLNWKITERRKLLLAAFSIDILITLSTFLYFAPETGELTAIPFSENINEAIQVKARRWESLNWIRIAAFTIASFLVLSAIGRAKSPSSN